MLVERCCGAVVFTRKENEALFVLVKSPQGYYGFPKGHMEPGETETETAMREILEETGLKPVLLPGFRVVDEHLNPQKPSVIKRIVYFLGEYKNQKLVYQKEELRGAYLLPYAEAAAVCQFESTKRILAEANAYRTGLGSV